MRFHAALLAAALAAAGYGCSGQAHRTGATRQGSDRQIQNEARDAGKTRRENYAGEAANGAFRSPQEAQRQSDMQTKPAPPAAKDKPLTEPRP